METIDSPVAHFTEVVKSPKAAPDCKRYLNKQTTNKLIHLPS